MSVAERKKKAISAQQTNEWAIQAIVQADMWMAMYITHRIHYHSTGCALALPLNHNKWISDLHVSILSYVDIPLMENSHIAQIESIPSSEDVLQLDLTQAGDDDTWSSSPASYGFRHQKSLSDVIRTKGKDAFEPTFPWCGRTNKVIYYKFPTKKKIPSFSFRNDRRTVGTRYTIEHDS